MVDTKTPSEEKNQDIVLSRKEDGRYLLTDLSGDCKKEVDLDKQTASKLLLLSSLGETEKANRLISQKMNSPVIGFRVDPVLQNETGNEQKQEKQLQDNGKNSVLNAHVTGIGAGGDFHLTARVKNERSGEIREVKGMITGLDAALLRSDTNGQGKDGTVLRNAQALASENFEKAWSVAFSQSHAVTMRMG